jgi:hypothetical protein
MRIMQRYSMGRRKDRKKPGKKAIFFSVVIV